jgi:hypothetical protein
VLPFSYIDLGEIHAGLTALPLSQTMILSARLSSPLMGL